MSAQISLRWKTNSFRFSPEYQAFLWGGGTVSGLPKGRRQGLSVYGGENVLIKMQTRPGQPTFS